MYLFRTDQQLGQDLLLDILPKVSEVNAISEELDKLRSFEVFLLPASIAEAVSGNNKDT